MNKKTVIASVLAVITTLALSTMVSAEEKRKGPPRGGKPPAEAIAACASLSEAASCSFNSPRGDVTGTCKGPPSGEGELACAPERGEKGERPSK